MLAHLFWGNNSFPSLHFDPSSVRERKESGEMSGTDLPTLLPPQLRIMYDRVVRNMRTVEPLRLIRGCVTLSTPYSSMADGEQRIHCYSFLVSW